MAPRALNLQTVRLAGLQQPLFPTVARNTGPASLIGTPSITLPLRRSTGQVPLGVMLEGQRGADRHLLALAARVQAVLVTPRSPPARRP